MRPREKAIVPEQDHQTAFGICSTCNARQIIDFSIGWRGELVESLPCGGDERSDGSVCDAAPMGKSKRLCAECGSPKAEVEGWGLNRSGFTRTRCDLCHLKRRSEIESSYRERKRGAA